MLMVYIIKNSIKSSLNSYICSLYNFALTTNHNVLLTFIDMLISSYDENSGLDECLFNFYSAFFLHL